MEDLNLGTHPIHLGLGATAIRQPLFNGEIDWYEGYGQRHADDGAEGRLVAMHTFTSNWDSWEVHPHGHEVVVVTAGSLTLIQEIDGEEVRTELTAGEAAINEPGIWHTADCTGPVTALFITAGMGTENRQR
ncbi:MAG: cupin domain-containing protein [Acidimicrobiales bacterium]